MSDVINDARAVLPAWTQLAGGSIEPLGTGLINDTFLVWAWAEHTVLQRLHPAFKATVHEDIEAVTAHLAAKGLVTPRLVRTNGGALFVSHEDRVWRAMTYLENACCFDKIDAPSRAFEAGALVGRFHHALRDLEHTYVHVRPGVHDLPRHLSVLRDALENHGSHRLISAVRPIATALFSAAEQLAPIGAMRPWHAHGDLKLSNLLFDAAGKGLCLVDLDTLAPMPLAHELGDALRSWCNPLGEDVDACEVDEAIFRAALEGYAQSARGSLEREEVDALSEGLSTIALELAARFLADALNERYFGWKPALYPGRGEHNLQRAKGQWSLAQSAIARRDALRTTARRAFAE